MAAYASPQAVVNAALELIASQTVITALNDGTQAGNAAGVIYAPTVQLLLREIDPDFARQTVTLALSGAPTPVPPWAFEYVYPATCVRLRQVRPPLGGAGSLVDPNDPVPIKANVAFDSVGSPAAPKVILTNQASALAVITSSAVVEAQWDSVFADAVVRRLANPLAMALSGRPDFAAAVLEQSAMMAQTSEHVDEGGFRRG